MRIYNDRREAELATAAQSKEKRNATKSGAARVATLGVFDGVHAGHQAILRATARAAKAAGSESLVLTFRNHPRELLSGAAPPSICSLEQRIQQFENLGIDVTVALRFDEALRDLPAAEFLDTLLRKECRVGSLVLGFDARFGNGREGTAEFARARGWNVDVVAPVLVDGVRVSSGAVRAAIAEGRLADARKYLARNPSIRGTVARGDGRGRTLGFATANLELHHALRPPRGVYAGIVDIGGAARRCVVNLGVRPTFGKTQETVEAHILDFEGDLYGQTLEIDLLSKIRDEMKFDSVDALKQQITRDVAASRAL